MTASPEVLRYAAFTDTATGGNPAGVVLDARGMADARMLALAAEIGYSETAFLTPRPGGREYDVRYFSAEAEVPFCGHATIASAVAVADRNGPGDIVFHIAAGLVPVNTSRDESGAVTASLTSVAPEVSDAEPGDLEAALRLLGWSPSDLDAALPPRIAYAGVRHLILAAKSRERLAELDYDFDGLKTLMLRLDLTTVDLVWREREDLFHARNPFPVGGVVEDPATGAAAAALGAYLRELGLVTPPATVTILQGEDMGRPSRLTVRLPADRPEITVSGQAVPIAPAAGEIMRIPWRWS
jgi:PhzF family phenazine biosynthesis protein